MSVPPELIQRMMQGSAGGAPTSGPPGQGPGAAPSTPPSPAISAPAGSPPAAAPFSTPQKKKGLQAAALTNMHIAVNMLEEALPAFGSESEEGGDILKALNILRRHVSKKDHGDLVPAEIMQLAQRSTQMGGGSSVQRQILQQLAAAGKQPPQGAPA